MAIGRRFPGNQPQIAVRFDEADRAILESVCDLERLTASDVIRRAVRAYAKTLGVTPEQQKQSA